MAAQLRWAFATLSTACSLKLVLLSMIIPKDFGCFNFTDVKINQDFEWIVIVVYE